MKPKNQEKTIDMPHFSDKLYHINLLYVVNTKIYNFITMSYIHISYLDMALYLSDHRVCDKNYTTGATYVTG